ncbi:hypothetical protein EVAR_75383_1 [Eumeta japonica]|uniref:Uncharacterized protein n=1 Tax=Eumeta variegata TaxID=151549 RepID=A0A4C1TKQ9_EUMVA|nr:hypothetical protein EVAR_75383_1 [Eumeta japonica]
MNIEFRHLKAQNGGVRWARSASAGGDARSRIVFSQSKQSNSQGDRTNYRHIVEGHAVANLQSTRKCAGSTSEIPHYHRISSDILCLPEAGNVLVTLLGIRVSMGSDDHLLFYDLYAHLPLDKN